MALLCVVAVEWTTTANSNGKSLDYDVHMIVGGVKSFRLIDPSGHVLSVVGEDIPFNTIPRTQVTIDRVDAVEEEEAGEPAIQIALTRPSAGAWRLVATSLNHGPVSVQAKADADSLCEVADTILASKGVIHEWRMTLGSGHGEGRCAVDIRRVPKKRARPAGK